MKKAFTLIELLVVIGIIGILAGIVMTSFSGGTESARAAKCLSNMRNLAQGAIGFTMTHYNDARHCDNGYPYAGSFPVVHGVIAPLKYRQCIGWISWLTMNGEYDPLPTTPVRRDNISACGPYDESATFAITNGTMWKCVGQNRSVYVCPEHERLAAKYKTNVRFSYVMNGYFGFDRKDSGADSKQGRTMHGGMNAARTLLFAELPFGVAGSSWDKANSDMPDDKAYATANGTPSLDCVLQFYAQFGKTEYNKDFGGTSETIAFNHKSGKSRCAHVVFADGHAEKLLMPKRGNGLSAEDLTKCLCCGVAVSYNDNDGYAKLGDPDDNSKSGSKNPQ